MIGRRTRIGLNDRERAIMKMNRFVPSMIIVSFAVAVLAWASLVGAEGSSGARPQTRAGDIERLDPRLDKLIPKDARLEKLGDVYHWVEGPVWNRKEGFLLFSDIPANAIIKWK